MLCAYDIKRRLPASECERAPRRRGPSGACSAHCRWGGRQNLAGLLTHPPRLAQIS